MDDEAKWMVKIGAGVVLLALCAVSGCMFGLPRYRVWEQGMTGKAALARADQDRQIQIAEARAKKESASLLADSEIERARGVAEANKIIGHSLQDNEAYLRWLYIQGITEGNAPVREVIYLPTEAGIPILEAQRLPGVERP